MKNRASLAALMIAGIACLCLATQAKANVLFEDNFDDGDIATGSVTDTIPGFDVSDATSPVYVHETGGNAILDASGAGNWADVGMGSKSSFDGGAQSQLIWEIVISSWTGSDRDKKLAFGLLPGGGTASIAGDGYDADAEPGLTVQIRNSNGKFGLFAQDVNGNNARDALHEDDSVTTSELEDGFTITITADASGWALDITGADSIADASGNWGSSGFSDIFNSTTYVRAYNKDGTDHTAVTEVDSISVLVPEPASLALLGLGGLLMMPRRRR